MPQSPDDRAPVARGWLVVAVGYQWIYSGVNFLAFKVAVDALPPLMIATMRFTLAALLILPFGIWRLRRHAFPTARQTASAALIGAIMLVAGQTLSIWGVQYMPAGVASVFGSTPPLFLALFAWAFLHQPLGRRQLLGIAVGFSGLALMGWHSAAAGDFKIVGAVAMLGGTAAWAAGSLIANRLSLPADAVLGMTVQLVAAAALLLLLTLATGTAARLDYTAVPLRAWAAISFLVVASTLIGYAVFLWINHAVSSTLANTFSYVAPVIAMIVAAIFLGEPLSWIKAAAASIALAGVAIMVGSRKSRVKTPGQN